MKINCPKACGECCKVIVIENKSHIPKMEQWLLRKDEEAKWLVNNLKKIHHLKAIRLNPLFKGQASWDVEFFVCRNFDYDKLTCTAYNKWRPIMCTDYPKYDKAVLNAEYFWNVPNCYFINQLMKVG